MPNKIALRYDDRVTGELESNGTRTNFLSFSIPGRERLQITVLIFFHFSTRTAKILPGNPNFIVVTSRALLNHLRFFGK